jgi:hypothetical protein
MPRGNGIKVAPEKPHKKGKKAPRGQGGGAANREGNYEAALEAQAKARARNEAKAAQRAKKRKVRGAAKVSAFTQLMRGLFARDDVPLNAKSRALVNSLMMTEGEVWRLKDIYDSVDADLASEMDFDEFFALINEPRTSFTDYIFTIIENIEKTGIELVPEKERMEEELENDAPGTALYARGFMTFDDFVQVVCTFAMYSEDDILVFSFNQFDKDNTGVIDEREFIALCMMVNNDAPQYPDNFKLSLATFDKRVRNPTCTQPPHPTPNPPLHLRPILLAPRPAPCRNPDGMMDFRQFKNSNTRFPLTLFPAFRLQDKIRQTILGAAAWLDISRRIEEEKEREIYRRKFNKEMPLSPVEQLCSLFKRQSRGVRAKKVAAMSDTAAKKALLTANKQADTQVEATEAKLRREGRGAKAVGQLKTGKLKMRKKAGQT